MIEQTDNRKIFGLNSQYKFSQVIITHYNDSAFSHEHGGVEYLSLNFTKIEKTFTPRGADSKALSPICSGYDLQQAQKL